MSVRILPATWIVGPPAPPVVALLVRVLYIAIITLVSVWVWGYLGGVSLSPTYVSEGVNETGKLFNWHPVLMTTAFAVLMSEAIMSYKAPILPWLKRAASKKLHACLHAAAAVCIVCGLTAAFKSHSLKLPIPIPDLYSPHSMLGLTTTILWSLQILGAAVAYHWPGISLPGRVALGPVHRHMGGSVWALGLATMATGITEKTTFVATAKKLAGDDLYGAIVRIPGAVLVLLALLGVTALYLQAPAAGPVFVGADGEMLLQGCEGSAAVAGTPSATHGTAQAFLLTDL
ncbi:MAG: hypothetical protein WDW36_003740 [Sanguina aurantia]